MIRESTKTAEKVIFICSSSSVRPFRADGATVIPAGHDWFNAYQILEKELVQGDVALIKGRITQRLDRLILALQGIEVGCRVSSCKSSIRPATLVQCSKEGGTVCTSRCETTERGNVIWSLTAHTPAAR